MKSVVELASSSEKDETHGFFNEKRVRHVRKLSGERTNTSRSVPRKVPEIPSILHLDPCLGDCGLVGFGLSANGIDSDLRFQPRFRLYFAFLTGATERGASPDSSLSSLSAGTSPHSQNRRNLYRSGNGTEWTWYWQLYHQSAEWLVGLVQVHGNESVVDRQRRSHCVSSRDRPISTFDLQGSV